MIYATQKTHENPDLFRIRQDQFIDMKHELVIIADKINWSFFEEKFSAYYEDKKGRPGTPIRLMVGLNYLKHAFDESDESVVYGFVENPYWQYFCGYDYFQKSLPIDPSSLTRFRNRIGSEGMEYLLQALLETARDVGALKDSHISKVNIDTTVQEKAIAFPIDANREAAIAFYRTAYGGNPRLAVEHYVGEKYIQHNPLVGDGKEAFIAYFESMSNEYPEKSIEFVRSVAKGDLVALHTHQTWPGGEEYVTMDFFRFDTNGKIIEHWDSIQQIPEETVNRNPMY